MNIDNLTAGLRRARLTIGGRHVPDLLHEPPEWTASANCLSVDPALFHPEKGGSTREAKSVCRGCPVTAECLAFGMDYPIGIYGGLSARERQRLARRPRTPEQSRVDQDANQALACPECGERGFRRMAMHRLKKHGVAA